MSTRLTAEQRRRIERSAPPRSADDRTVLLGMNRPATYEEALEIVRELEEEIESLDALLLISERAVNDSGQPHGLADAQRSSAQTTCSSAEDSEGMRPSGATGRARRR
jgi:hypothetical protein